MVLSKKDWAEVNAILDRVIDERNTALRDLDEAKKIVIDRDLTIRAKDKYISQLSAGKLALEVTLSETLGLINNVTKKLGISKRELMLAPYQEDHVAHLIKKLDERA